MAKLTAQELIDAIKELSVLELNDLVKACEEEFGVSANNSYACSCCSQWDVFCFFPWTFHPVLSDLLIRTKNKPNTPQ